MTLIEKDSEIDLSNKVREAVLERRKVELLLRESEKRYRDLLTHLPVGVYRTTPDGRIIEANRRLAELLGYEDPEQLLDVVVSDLYVQVVTGQSQQRQQSPFGQLKVMLRLDQLFHDL